MGSMLPADTQYQSEQDYYVIQLRVKYMEAHKYDVYITCLNLSTITSVMTRYSECWITERWISESFGYPAL